MTPAILQLVHLLAPILSPLSTADFWKSPTGSVLVGVASYYAKTSFDQRQQRKKLLDALLAEVTTSKLAIEEIARDFPSRSEADAIVNAVEAGKLSFDVLDRLPGGFAVFPPALPYSELITRLRTHEARAAIQYVDAWARFVDLEKRYAASYSKFVDLAPTLNGGENQIHVKEVAHQVRGYLRQLLRVLKDLSVARARLEALADSRFRWHAPLGKRPASPAARAPLAYPDDWNAKSASQDLDMAAPTEVESATQKHGP